MKTVEVMTSEPRAVIASERLDAAARALWEQDCGMVPVVDRAGVLVGVITDRDLCMASYIQGRALREIPVSAAMARSVATCRSDDSVADVMEEMRRLQVHRLPVTDAGGRLVGVVSTNDLVRASHARPAAVDPKAVIRTLAVIGTPRRRAIRSPDAGPAVASGPQSTKTTRAVKPAAPAKKKQAAGSRSSSKGNAAKPAPQVRKAKAKARKKI